ncbi:MAG: methyltransferase domain-containing protein [Gemmatimonadaceae bacterium]|nr:methyltransferase domain-containing protein [Gemmatimonadaceae bacterium]
MGKINPLIAFGIPTWGKVSIGWAQAYRHLNGPLGSNMMELAPAVGQPIAEARNGLMESAIANGCDYLFMLGDDVLPQGDALIRLLQRMWDDPTLHLATGVYWTKQWPTQPYIWRGMQRGPYLDWKYGEYFEVDFAGCDCLLIRLSPEIKALGPTWFSTTWTWEDEPEEVVPMLATEDFYFYTRARKQGIKLYCDTLVQCIHEDRNSGTQFALTTDMPQYGAPEPELPEAETDAAPLVKLADIGAGFNSPYFGRPDRVKVVRFDADEKAQPDYRCDVRRLPVPDQSFDVVHARHVLEHFGRKDVFKVLGEWARILRVGGEIRLSVPNVLTAMRNIILMEEGVVRPDPYPFWQVYGAQRDERDLHHNGFTPRRMQLLLEHLDIFEEIEVTTGDGEGDLNIYAKARKAKHVQEDALLPEWDAIEKKEGILLPGREQTNGHVEAEAVHAG